MQNKSVIYALIAATTITLIGGCSNNHINNDAPWFSLIHNTNTSDYISEATVQEAQYSEQAPCDADAGYRDANYQTKRCSRSNPTHVAYWLSRPDTFRIACNGEPQDYCTHLMVPHCHGFGSARFCHSHPGGEVAHHHISDMELAAISIYDPE